MLAELAGMQGRGSGRVPSVCAAPALPQPALPARHARLARTYLPGLSANSMATTAATRRATRPGLARAAASPPGPPDSRPPLRAPCCFADRPATAEHPRVVTQSTLCQKFRCR